VFNYPHGVIDQTLPGTGKRLPPEWALQDPLDYIEVIRQTVPAVLRQSGVKAEDVIVMAYPNYGVKLYGNVVIAGEDFLKKNPEAVKAFLRAFSKGVKDVVADPAAAVATVKARDGIVNEALELRRLKLALDATVLTPDAKAEGFGNVMGPRLSLMASQVADAYGTKERINPDVVWNGSFLPSAAERNIFAVAKK
jgi:NitT/TauT family transport system substrate-binding protein